MSVALGWTILSVMIVGFIAVVAMVRSDVGRLDTKIDTKIDALTQEVHTLAERQAQMNGQLDVVVRQAHTHPVG